MGLLRTISASLVFSAILCISLGTARATVINTDWISNATSNTNIVEGVFAGSERPRLGNFTSGSIEGTVLLPFFDTWTINTLIRSDESPSRDPSDTVTVFIDNVQLGVFSNTPASVDFPFAAMITGSQFDYRFEFLSGNAVEVAHMLVLNGTASTVVPAPGMVLFLGLGLVGLGLARRRTAH